jgi:beta-lactamase class D
MLGTENLTNYARNFGYGNADFSGDAGYDNGLERAWISSSLKVSPLEQAGFIAALLEGELPVSAQAHAGALSIVESAGTIDGWTLWGKTGSAYPRNADRSFNYANGWGWYVGWAQKDEQKLVFARLIQDEQRHQESGGRRVQATILTEWPALVARAGF